MGLLKQSHLWIHVDPFNKFLGIHFFSHQKNMAIANGLDKKSSFFKPFLQIKEIQEFFP